MRKVLIAAMAITGVASPVAPALAQRDKVSSARQDNGERLICRTRTETGSLSRRERHCFTAEQWRRLSEESQNASRDMQDRNRGAPPGGN